MTGVELIVAALAAGAGAGASAAAVDAYNGLRDSLRRRITGRGVIAEIVEAGQTDQETLGNQIGTELGDCGADRDEEILTAAQRVLDLVDQYGSQNGRYITEPPGLMGVDLREAALKVNIAYGPTAGIMTGPVSVSYGQMPVPPAVPGV